MGLVNTKSILQSKTFWGAAVSLFAVLCPGVFMKLGIDANGLTDKIVGAIGGGLAIYGRLAATQVVTVLGGPVDRPVPLLQPPPYVPPPAGPQVPGAH
jgi:hypothetical protein